MVRFAAAARTESRFVGSSSIASVGCNIAVATAEYKVILEYMATDSTRYPARPLPICTDEKEL